MRSAWRILERDIRASFRNLLRATFATSIALLASYPTPAQKSAGQPKHIASVMDVSPDHSDSSDADGASGGRVNGMALAVDDKIVYAASEWGGLFKSQDGGQTWRHLDGHAPSATWRVKVDPKDFNHAYATSFYDGRVASLSGINVTADGGKSWFHPRTAIPPANFCGMPAAETELAAYGISIDPVDSKRVYVGTNCGLAVSTNRGVSWSFINVSAPAPAGAVWDVLAHGNGLLDTCGDDGHVRSTNGGMTWNATNSLPSARCSLAGSPDEPNVLFAVVGSQPYESDDSGLHWSALPSPESTKDAGRIPFVMTNKRAGSAFDLWFGNVGLYRTACRSLPGTAGEGPRCGPPDWKGPFTRDVGGHDDVAGITFSTVKRTESCPSLFSSDGGIYINKLKNSVDCHDPQWTQPRVTPRALWLFTLEVSPNISSKSENLYIGNQDNGAFVTKNGSAPRPEWLNTDCCDSFAASMSPSRLVYTVCCFGTPPNSPPVRANQITIRDSKLANPTEINNYPPGEIPGWEPHVIAEFDVSKYAVITSTGVYYTDDIAAIPIKWLRLGTGLPGVPCSIVVSKSAYNGPIFFVQTESCDGSGPSAIYRLDGPQLDSSSWKQVLPPEVSGTFGIFAVDASNSLRFLASVIFDDQADVKMFESLDGGQTWENQKQLDGLMTGNGSFKYKTLTGPTDFTSFDGYAQPTLVAFDPENQDLIVAAGADSGVFISFDRGHHWEIVSLHGRVMHRARAVQFVQLDSTRVIFLGSQGDGIWRVNLTD